jgi:3-oxoacyl-[acyl-carrier-protein] synthase-1
LNAVNRAFEGSMPPFSSTKSLTGHSLGAAGVQEAIYCLLMQKEGFITGSANVTERDPGAAEMPLVTDNRDADLSTVMSNSFGFGGTNAALIFKRL